MNILVRCVLIFISIFLFFFFLLHRKQPYTASGMLSLSLIILAGMIFYLNKTNRLLVNFLIHLQEEDLSLSYSAKKINKNFRSLYEQLEKILLRIKENRIEVEIQKQFLESILKDISTGIICLNDKGKVVTINKAALQLLGGREISNIQNLNKFKEGLANEILDLDPGRFITLDLKGKRGKTSASITTSDIKIRSKKFRIVSINDISHQMEEQEISAWKKLIRVINHEIMNSMTPITTLTLAIRNKLTKNGKVGEPCDQTKTGLEEAVRSAKIIEERSVGLIHFIKRYNELTSLSSLKLAGFKFIVLLHKVEEFFSKVMEQQNINFLINCDENIQIVADEKMLEQVMINLVKNAVEATKDSRDPQIKTSCYLEDNSLLISVSDNGEGIPQDKLEQVFVPFFTTRIDGSGIGLSLCKQIIQMHDGQIDIQSEIGKGSTVNIRLRIS